MRIAVPYEDGQIFQHFGKTAQFKVYTIENDTVVSTEIVETNGGGHDTMVNVLNAQGVTCLICGGMGDEAAEALMASGIEVYSGVEGNCDSAVGACLKGELVSAGVNCNHDGEDGGCGCGCGGSCGGGCGGGCAGCGAPAFDGPNVGKNVRVHYRGTLNDGTQFDSSYDRGETLDFVCGAGMMIRGFDEAVATMKVGEIVNVHLMPEEAYGPSDPSRIFTVEIAQLPGSEDLNVGEQVYLGTTTGQPLLVKVTAKDETMITFDANHEMAGKELNFQIELVEVVD